MKVLGRSIVISLAVFAMAAVAVMAAAPNVRSVFGAQIPTINGNANEWQTTPLNATNPDWFVEICTEVSSSNINCAVPRGDLFLRYNCLNHTLYGLGLADRGFNYTAGATSNYVTLFGLGTPLVNDGAPYTSNGSPPMWRDLTNGQGAEFAIATFDGTNAFVSGTTYHLVFHFDMGGAAVTNDADVTIPICTPLAVTVTSISAQTVDGWPNLVGIALGAGGLAVLGGLVIFASRKR